MSRRSISCVLALALGALASGCQPSVERVCGHLDDASCDVSYNDCVGDGNALQSDADAEDCGDLFSDYLDCVDGAGCAYESVCETEADALFACVGP